MRVLIITAVLLLGSACSPTSEEPPRSPVQAAEQSQFEPYEIPADQGITIAAGNARGAVGETIEVVVSMHNGEAGLSGYSFKFSVSNPALAQIVDVQLPDFGLSVVSDLPAATVDITAVDLPGLVEGNFTRAELATITVKLLASGSTRFVIEPRMIDDDQGDVINPSVVNGALNIN